MALKYLIEVVKIGGEEYWVEGPSQGNPIGMDSVKRSAEDGSDNYRQYINVNDKIKNKLDNKEKPAHGPKIIYKAGVDREKSSLIGKKVHFVVIYTPADGKPTTVRVEKKIKDNGWTKNLELDLSKQPGPGGTVQIEASLKDGKKLSRQPSGIKTKGVAQTESEAKKLTLGPYIVWRKIWFQASYMAGIGAQPGGSYWDLESVQKHYDPVFIQMEMAETKGMGLYIECINEGQHSAGFPKDFFNDQNKKFESLLTHLVFVDKMSKNADINLSIKLDGSGKGTTETTALLCGAKNGEWLFKEASYTDTNKKKVMIDKNWFEEINLSTTDGGFGVKTTIDVKKTDIKGSVTLKAYSVDVQNYNAGMAHGHDIYVALGQWKKDYPQKELGTIIHEFGHQLGMVPKGGNFIQDGGPHCTNKNCVMYKEQRVNKDRPLDFCDTCIKSLLKMNFKKLISVK